MWNAFVKGTSSTRLTFYSFDVPLERISACFDNEDEDGLLRNLSALTFNISLPHSTSNLASLRIDRSNGSKGSTSWQDFKILFLLWFFDVFDDDSAIRSMDRLDDGIHERNRVPVLADLNLFRGRRFSEERAARWGTRRFTTQMPEDSGC